MWGGVNYTGNELPWGLAKVPFLLVFYALGNYCNKHQWKIKTDRLLSADAMVIFFLLSFSLSSIYGASSIAYVNYALYYGLAGIGLLFISLMGKIFQSSKYLSYVGKNSFLFLVFHPVSVKVMMFFAYYFGLRDGGIQYLGVIVITSIMCFCMKYFSGLYSKVIHKNATKEKNKAG